MKDINNLLQQKSNLLLKISSLPLNLFPYLVFSLIIKQNTAISVLPFALFYAFRRTTLFLFKGGENEDNVIGWFGSLAALFGYFLGIFGIFLPALYCISASLAGIGAACFPSVQKQIAIESDYHPSKNDLFAYFGAILILLAIIVFVEPHLPTISFIAMLIYTLIAILGFKYSPFRAHSRKIVLQWQNVWLTLGLLLAILLIREGWNSGKDIFSIFGIIVSAVVVISYLIKLALSQKHGKLSRKMQYRLTIAGLCQDFTTIFSAVYISVLFGAKNYYWLFVIILIASFIKRPLLKTLREYLPFDDFTIQSWGIVLGLVITLFRPTYFAGIFLIRIFYSLQNTDTLDLIRDHVDTNIYMINYRFRTAGGFLTQLILWGGLLLFNGPHIFEQIFNYHINKSVMNSSQPLFLTHLILVLFIVSLTIYTLKLNKRNKNE